MIAIKGDGVAANACARLCSRLAIPAAMKPADRSRVPALLIGDTTQALFADIFSSDRVFENARRITKRVVAWGGAPRELPHSAVVIGEAQLEERLRGSNPPAAAPADWTVFTIRPLPEGAQQLRFGSRVASACPIQLKDERDAETCWIESVETGWLFLLPGWLLAVGDSASCLLASSRVVSARIDRVDAPGGDFPAHPRITEPLCAPGWLACGSAAMAFDPIAGDGAGNALREAILAVAVMRAAMRGDPVDGLLDHYRTRLIAGFARHLELCRPFYAAIDGDWWRAELAELDRGIAWCRERLRGNTFRYQLRGFDLEPIPNSAA